MFYLLGQNPSLDLSQKTKKQQQQKNSLSTEFSFSFPSAFDIWSFALKAHYLLSESKSEVSL